MALKPQSAKGHKRSVSASYADEVGEVGGGSGGGGSGGGGGGGG